MDVSIHPVDLFSLNQRISEKLGIVQITMVHIHTCDLVVFVCCIIIDSFICITAGSVERDLILAICNFTAAPLLIDRSENVEKLADALCLAVAGF